MKILSALKIARRNKPGKGHLSSCMAHYNDTVYFQVKAVGTRQPLKYKHNIPDQISVLSVVLLNIWTSVSDKILILYLK